MSSATQFGTGPEKLLLTITDPSSPRALAMLYAYYDNVASSYYGRPATPEEVSAAMLDEPSDDLRAEEGIFAIATRGAAPVGCGGVRFVDSSIGELTRVFVLLAHARPALAQPLSNIWKPSPVMPA